MSYPPAGMTPVRITGIGACTPLGMSWKTTRQALLDGKTAPEPESVHDKETALARIEKPFEGDKPRFHHLAVQAIEDLQRRTSFSEKESVGLVASTSKGGLGGGTKDDVLGLHNPGIWASALADKLPSVDRVTSPNTACATGLTALIQGTRWIADNRVNHAVIVSSESCFYPLMLAGYSNLGVLCDSSGMKPFHPERSGFALAEGAAAVLLSNANHAQNKNRQRNTVDITGWGETSDAHHITRMNERAPQTLKAIELSLEQSGLRKRDVDFVHAHLTTTHANDKAEGKLLEHWSGNPKIQAIKPALGHTIGAAGLLEIIATASTLRTGEFFPLPTGRRADLPSDHLWPEDETRTNPEVAVSWNMGFGGHNAAVVLRANN